MDLTTPYRKTAEQIEQEYAQTQEAFRQRYRDVAQANIVATQRRRERTGKWLYLAMSLLVPLIILYGIWYFVIEPVIHYHSLSVACASHNITTAHYACAQLLGY
jgi:hypothetical protein